MKRIALIIVLALTFSAGYSQVFTLGPKIGLNYSNIVFDESFTSDGLDFSYLTHDAKVGFVAGGFIRLSFAGIHLQPEVLFSQDQSLIEVGDLSFQELSKIKVNKVDVPMLIGFSLGRVFRVQGGPVMTHILNMDIESSAGNTLTSAINNFDENKWGYQLGIGFDIRRFTLDLRYEGNLSKIGTEIEIGEETFNFDYRKRAFQATLGFKLIN